MADETAVEKMLRIQKENGELKQRLDEAKYYVKFWRDHVFSFVDGIKEIKDKVDEVWERSKREEGKENETPSM